MPRIVLAWLGAGLGAELVAIPCAIIYGHSGPSWPIIPLVLLGLLGAVCGWRLGKT